MTASRWKLLIPVGAIAYLGTPHVLFAQETDSAEQEKRTSEQQTTAAGVADIVVTAQHREQRLQDVPIAIDTLDATQLEARGIRDLTANSLNQVSPSLTGQFLTGRQSYFIRGVGTNAAENAAEPSVALYVDGVYMGNGAGNQYEFNNIERIEILKGPQGTLFGRNTTGGVIQVVTKKPSLEEPVLEARAGYGNFETYAGAFYASMPVSNTLAVDFSVNYKDRTEGYGYNYVRDERINEGWSLGLRSKIRFAPTDRTEIILTGDYSEFDNNNSQQQHVDGTCDIFGYCTNQISGFDSFTDAPRFFRGSGKGVSAHMTQEEDFATFESITSYRRDELELFGDLDITPFPIATTGSHSGQKLFTQELRVSGSSNSNSGFDWMFGVFYMNRSSVPLPDNLAIFAPALLGPAMFQNSTTDISVRSIAPFAQVTYEVVPNIELTAGLRFTMEEAESDQTVVTALGTTVYPHQTTSFNEFTWRLAANYEFAPDIHIYLSYNRGLKSGGFNQAIEPYPPYRPEILDAYEIGLKSQLLDNRIRLNLAGFYYDYKDIQQNGYPGIGTQVAYNAAAAEIYGIDGSIDIAVTDNLTISSGFAILDSKFTEFEGLAPTFTQSGTALLIDPTGNSLPFASPFVSNITANYNLPTDIGDFSATATYTYNDGYAADVSDRPTARFPSYDLLSATVGWTSSNGRFGIDLWGKNLLDSYYLSTLTTIFLGDFIVPAEPRTYGFTLHLNL